MIHQVTSESDFESILENNPKVLMEFYASWCPHCKAFYPVLNAASAQLGEEGVYVAQTEVDTFPDLAENYDVQSIPTLVYFSDGEAVLKTTGERDEQAVFAFVREGEMQ